MKETKPYGTVLLKAAKIMDCLSLQPDQTLQEIAKNTEMTASTAIKILETLTLIGYVQKDTNKTYRLGTKLIRYANQSVEQIDLAAIAVPYLENLHTTVDETIHLGILNNNEILYINKLEPKNQTIRMSSKVGITRPLYNSAMGKAVLAEFSEEQVQQYLDTQTLIPYTENTITNPLRLKKELKQVQQTGVAYDDEEIEQDIFCSGVSLMKDGEIAGAFSVSMPKYRLTEENKTTINQALLATKAAIEAKL